DGRARRADVLAQREEMIVLFEDGAQQRVALRGADLREGGIEIDVDRGPTASTVGRDAVHAGEVHQQVGLTEEARRPARSGPMLPATCRVDEDPAVAETEPAEELSGKAYAVLVDGVERTRVGIVGGRVVAGVLVEPDVVPERAEAEEVVCRLPRVAAEGIPD